MQQCACACAASAGPRSSPCLLLPPRPARTRKLGLAPHAHSELLSAVSAAPSSRQATQPASTSCAAGHGHAAGSTAGAAKLASLTRILLVSNPGSMFRSLSAARTRVAGPISLLLFVAGLFAFVAAAIRAVLAKRTRSCKCCSGFGIIRCRLCDGLGKVGWRAKFNYNENCPLCYSKRYVVCPDCGGYYHKPMFPHMNRPSVEGI